MKRIIAVLSIAVFLLAGCIYDAPLTTDHSVPVDTAVLGLWAEVVPEGETKGSDDELMILKFSETEYLIHYPTGTDDGLYYRGYPIEVGGISCVQLQVIGNHEGAVVKEAERYNVASYQVKEGQLQIRLLNTELVKDDLKTADELVQAFLGQKENEALFGDSTIFRKVN